MKNLAKNAGLLFVALGALCVTSCTKDDIPSNEKSVETTSVAFSVNADNDVSATGKMIDRNSAPLFVDNLTIWANSIYPNCNVLETFTFGTSTATNPLQTGFSLNNVALGTNTFGATSNASESDNRLSLGSVILPNNSANVLDVMKAHVPYIRCYSLNNASVVIKKTGNDPVALTMKTDYGRILAKFVQAAPDADNYIATVSATVADMNDNGEWITRSLPEVTVTSTTGFEWSNPYAMDGQVATFTIKVYDKLAGGVKGQLLNTITKSATVSKSKTTLCTFTVKNTDVHTDIEAGGIVLTFPTIEEVIVND